MGSGFAIIGVSRTPQHKNQQPLGEDGNALLYPTGAYMVITMEAAALNFHKHREFAAMMRAKRMLMDQPELERLANSAKHQAEEEEDKPAHPEPN